MLKENRPNREESKHVRRKTLEDTFAAGRLTTQGLDKNYHYRIENDEGGKIERLKDLGYEVVTHNEGVKMGDANAKEVGTAISTTVNKEGTKAYLLKQPKEFYEEDCAFEQKQIDESEKALFRQIENESGRYGSIKPSDE